jgi:hypothetical protein
MSEVPIRSVQFPTVLAVAAILGVGIGTWLGRLETNAPQASNVPSPAATASPGLSPSPSNSTLPSALASDTSQQPTPETILELSGITDEVSADFEVVRGWQIVWQTDGEHFAFAVRGDHNIGTIVDRRESGSGQTSIAPAGTFHIEVTATGSWSLKVVQGQG